MKKERAHCENVASVCKAFALTALIAESSRRLYGKAPMPMRPRYDPKRAIISGAVIEVDPHGSEHLQYGHRRLDVQDAFLYAPAAALGMRDAFLDRNTQVLMQWNEPVSVRGLVEERALHSHSAAGK